MGSVTSFSDNQSPEGLSPIHICLHSDNVTGKAGDGRTNIGFTERILLNDWALPLSRLDIKQLKSRYNMQTLDFSREEFVSTMAQLGACYGLTEKALPVSLQDWLHIDVGQRDRVTLSLIGSAEDLDAALIRLKDPDGTERRKVLLLLTYIMRNSGQVREMITTALFASLLEMDIARLSEFMDNIPPGEGIVLKGNKRCVKLTNYSDWIRKQLVQPYMDRYLGGTTGTKESPNENINDPRIPMVLTGTYRLFFGGEPTAHLSDGFCDLVLSLLKMQDIIPESSDKDRAWVRSEWDDLNQA